MVLFGVNIILIAAILMTILAILPDGFLLGPLAPLVETFEWSTMLILWLLYFIGGTLQGLIKSHPYLVGGLILLMLFIMAKLFGGRRIRRPSPIHIVNLPRNVGSIFK